MLTFFGETSRNKEIQSFSLLKISDCGVSFSLRNIILNKANEGFSKMVPEFSPEQDLTEQGRRVLGQLEELVGHVLAVVQDREPQLQTVLQEVDGAGVTQVGGEADHRVEERGQGAADGAKALRKQTNTQLRKLICDVSR